MATPLQHINISAAPGQPSTFWISASGRYYRTADQAREDNPDLALNPADYTLTKSFWQRNRAWLLPLIILAALALLIWYLRRKNILRIRLTQK